MRRKPCFSYVNCLIVVSITLIITGCASTTEYQRGTLSEAVKKSSDDNKGDRKVADSHSKQNGNSRSESDNNEGPCWLCFLFANKSDEGSGSTNYDSEEKQARAVSVGVIGDVGANGYDYFSPFGGAAFRFSVASTERLVHSFDLRLSYIPQTRFSELYRSANSIQTFAGAYLFRYAFHDSVSGPYMSLGLEIRKSSWTYNNPVTSKVYDDFNQEVEVQEITNDNIMSVSPGIGMGYFMKYSHGIRPSIEVRIGGNLYSDKTSQGFLNDIFRGDGFIKVLLGFEWFSL